MRAKTLNGRTITPIKKRTSIGNGLRKRGSYKKAKAYRGQGR